MINSAIDTMPPRPYRLSTMDEYTSWDSLTDRTYSVRELDAVPAEPPTQPPEADVVELFRRSQFSASEKSTVLFAYVAQWFTDGFLRSPRFDKDGKEIIKDRDVTRNDSTHQVGSRPGLRPHGGGDRGPATRALAGLPGDRRPAVSAGAVQC